MRDKTHADFIERWVKYMKDHPKEWKKHHTEFINAQFKKAEEFWKKADKKLLEKIYRIKNKKGYPSLFK